MMAELQLSAFGGSLNCSGDEVTTPGSNNIMSPTFPGRLFTRICTPTTITAVRNCHGGQMSSPTMMCHATNKHVCLFISIDQVNSQPVTHRYRKSMASTRPPDGLSGQTTLKLTRPM
eukprot:TRINITY_DN74656_c0_g1_i1.p1 TRINITY_DN74656_c0_g1~~TRINITY_DN74656_c0_g1_i1.p1  ORF type:complete len:117 (+),score=13.73 TRINITY_DN74656_c0_g1_i1:51-401(+)